jgi:CRP-like cAMP-binding protein
MPYSNRTHLQRFLGRLTSRSVLSEEERQAILNLPSHAQQVRANRDFVSLGETVDHSCLVMAGLVGRFGQNLDGKRQITAIHIPGDMADLHSVVEPSPTSALQALSVSTILCIPHSALREAASQYPAIAEAFWRDCVIDAGILSQWIVNVGRRDAKQRIAHLICEIATRMVGPPADDAIAFDLPITQMQLADATGLTSVHVNRTLQMLRSRGIIEWSRANIVRVPQWDALAGIGEFDAGYLQLRTKPRTILQVVRAS